MSITISISRRYTEITETSLGSLFRLITITRITLSNPLKRNLKKAKGALISHLSSSMDRVLERFGTFAGSKATGEVMD
jgi:hypothetical protein